MIRSKRTLRIKQGNGFATSTDTLISPLAVPSSLLQTRGHFHGLSWAEGPLEQGTASAVPMPRRASRL